MGKRKKKASNHNDPVQGYTDDMSLTQELVRHLDGSCEAQFTIYKVENGYNILVMRQRWDSSGSCISRTHKIIYVKSMAEIPTVMIANGAADKLGVA